jgi:hypothetical protein
MSQILDRSANTLSKVSIFGVLSLVDGLVRLAIVIGRSPYATTKQGLLIEQPLAEPNNHPCTTWLALVRHPNIEPQDFVEFDRGDQPVHDRVDAEAREKEWFISSAAIGPVRV